MTSYRIGSIHPGDFEKPSPINLNAATAKGFRVSLFAAPQPTAFAWVEEQDTGVFERADERGHVITGGSLISHGRRGSAVRGVSVQRSSMATRLGGAWC